MLEDFHEHRLVHFGKVTRSWFTIVRCLFGDCSDARGRPITLVLGEVYREPFHIVYMVVMVMIGLGAFNIIVAVFVERTFAVAQFNDEEQHWLREQERKMIYQKTRQLMLRIWECRIMNGDVDDGGGFATSTLNEETFYEALYDDEVCNLLDDLGVRPEDRPQL